MSSAASAIELGAGDRELLVGWVRAPATAQGVAGGARFVLAAAEGESNSETARRLGLSRPTVIMWRERFLAEAPAGLGEVRPGRGRKPQITGVPQLEGTRR